MRRRHDRNATRSNVRSCLATARPLVLDRNAFLARCLMLLAGVLGLTTGLVTVILLHPRDASAHAEGSLTPVVMMASHAAVAAPDAPSQGGDPEETSGFAPAGGSESVDALRGEPGECACLHRLRQMLFAGAPDGGSSAANPPVQLTATLSVPQISGSN